MAASGHDDFGNRKRHNLKYGFVYLWRDRKHKRYYVGCHWGQESDSYVCSSRWMKASYKRRPNDFKRRILARVYTSKVDLLEEEYRYLQMIKPEELRKRYYNISNHRFNHWSTMSSKSMSEKMSRAAKKLWTNEYKEIASENWKNKWNDSSYRTKMMALQSDKVIRQKETFKRIGHNIGTKNSNYGTIWVTDGVDNKKIKASEEIPTGFRKGRTWEADYSSIPIPPTFKPDLLIENSNKRLSEKYGVSKTTIHNWKQKSS